MTLPAPPLVTLGGNGANAAFVAARRGAAVTLHTSLAADALGDLARRWLEAAGCLIRTAPHVTATAINVTAADKKMRRATFFYRGAPVAMPRLSAAPSARLPRAVLVCGWPHPPLKKSPSNSRRCAAAVSSRPSTSAPFSRAPGG